LEPKEHYTDTHGYTDIIFGVCHLLGIRFAPRIKDLPEQRLWYLPAVQPFSNIEQVLSGKINRKLIEANWDEMIRVIASIRRGEVRASLIISKLTASGSRNNLFRGMQELGRLVKTAYLAEYLRDPELRRRVLLGLNKGESLNSLARKVAYGGKGELRDRTYEDQLNAASSLNLLLAAIVVWNAVHIQACLKRLRSDGMEIDESHIRYLSPLMKRHLNIYGQYAFDVERHAEGPGPDKLRY
ncbi:MAG: Tn3 family transposase, partial [Blastocatellia bacterium]